MINTNPSSTNTLRCQFQFSDGRSCRMLRNPAHPTFCTFHARQELQSIESQRLGDEISMSLNGDFLTATDINHVLGKLFIAVAQDRVPLRKALALTCLGKVMLTSLPPRQAGVPLLLQIRPLEQSSRQCHPLSTPPALTDSNSSDEALPELPEPDSPEEE